jgi:hypothetical protein
MVRPRTTLLLTHVSLTGRTDLDLMEFLADGSGRPSLSAGSAGALPFLDQPRGASS